MVTLNKVLLFAFVVFIIPRTAFALGFSSSDIAPDSVISQAHVMSRYGCDGNNISPDLRWNDPPLGVKSYAVSVYDLDAPNGWWHWLIYDIPSKVTGLPVDVGQSKDGNGPFGSHEAINDFGEYGWGGPCPPKGNKPHRYVFTLYALDVPTLPVIENSRAEKIVPIIKHYVISSISFIAYYGR